MADRNMFLLSKHGKRNTYLILIALLLVLAIFFLPQRGGDDSVKFPMVESEVDRVVFTRDDGGFALKLEGGRWLVEGKGYPVDGAKVNKAVVFIQAEREAEIVSEVDVYQPYGLDDKSRLQIEFYSQGDLLKTLYVGQSANRFGTFYGMIDDNPIVYQISFDRYDLDYQEEDILDLKVFNFSPPEVVRAKLVDQGGKHWDLIRKVVEKKNDENTNQIPAARNWENEKGDVFSKEKVNDIINTLSTLEGEDLIDDDGIGDSNVTSPLRKIELTDEGGKNYYLDIVTKTDDGYWVKNPDSDYFYLISDNKASKLLVNPSP